MRVIDLLPLLPYAAGIVVLLLLFIRYRRRARGSNVFEFGSPRAPGLRVRDPGRDWYDPKEFRR